MNNYPKKITPLLYKYFLACVLCIPCLTGRAQQQIDSVEWGVDNIAAYGQSPFRSAITAAPNVINFPFTVNLASTGTGLHTLFVRSHSSGPAGGSWGLTNYSYFYKQNNILTSVSNIQKLEYFIDTDPGEGNATAINVTPATQVSGISFNPNISALLPGFHILFIRSLDQNGKWSISNYSYFYKQNNILTSVSNIQKLEYFIDTDPGEGNATAISVTPATQVSDISFNPNISALLPGFHVLFIRSLDQNGKWSISNYTYFYKQNNSPTPVSTVTKMEYFIDTDPGEGSGQAIGFTPATAVSGLSFNADISTAAGGFHVIFIRSLDANGKWSITNYAYFFKAGSQAGAVPNIVKIEYFIDNDPGYFAANNVPLAPATDIANKSFSANISGATVGLHYLYVRSLDSKGLWSVNAYDTFRVNTVVPVTLISFNALAEKEHVNVTWQTAMEQGLSNFEVQRSDDGFHFTPLGSVIPWNVSTGAQYLFRDEMPLSGINYYRLKTTENNGSSSFSNIRAVVFSPGAAEYVIAPNPADRSFTIRSGAGSCSAEIITGNGVLVRSLKNIKPNDQISTIDLPAGLYVVRINSGSKQANLPLVIIH